MKDQSTDLLIHLTTAVHGMVGYCESLKPGTVINESYMTRMRDYYVANLLEAMGECRGRLSASVQKANAGSNPASPAAETLKQILDAMCAYHDLAGRESPRDDKQRISDKYTVAIMQLRAYIAESCIEAFEEAKREGGKLDEE